MACCVVGVMRVGSDADVGGQEESLMQVYALV